MRTREQPLVLGISGSPRRHGNSARLLDECLAAVEASGATAERIFLAEHDIAPCTGCGSCSRTGVCVIADDTKALHERVDAADAIVVASPVYFASVPAGLKAFYDRLQPYWARHYVLGVPAPARRPGALLLVRGGGDPYGHACAVTTTKSAFAVLGVDIGEVLVIEGPDAAGEIERHPDAFRRAREIGAALAGAAGSTG